MNSIWKRIRPWFTAEYRKAQAAAVLAVPVIVAALADGKVTGTEWIEIVAAVLFPPVVASVTNAAPAPEDPAPPVPST